MKKVLFFINTLDGGGAEKVLIDIVNNMDHNKYDITVQAAIDGGVHKSKLRKGVKYKSIVKVKNVFIKKLMIKLICFRLPAKLAYKWFVKADYDYEIAFLEGIPTKIISASQNENKFAWVHTDLYNNISGMEKVYRTIEKQRECYKKYKYIICVSESTKLAFKERFGFDSNVIVKYNPVDENKVKEKALEPLGEYEQNDKLKLITVGRLTDAKGYDRLLRIHKRLMDEGFSYELWIVGEGEKRAEFERYIEDNNLGSSVKLLGFQTNPYKFMEAADILTFPSKAEGYSTVATEGVILGKPIIVSDCSGMQEIFGDSEYGVVTENNEEALYEGIKNMLSDEKLRNYYTEKAQERRESFKMGMRIRDIEALFN